MRPHLKLLGGYELVAGNGKKIRLPTRKSWALLAYLVQSGSKEISREVLAALLWPRSGEDQARASLRQELAVLRKAMFEMDIEPIIAHKESIQFRPDLLSIDTYQLIDIAENGANCDLRKVADLFTGEFIGNLNIRSENFEEWVWIERQSLRDTALGCLNRALAQDEETGNATEIITTARLLLNIDPTAENAHRALMQSFWQTGRKAEALNQYKRCQNILLRELDTRPSAATQELADKIRNPIKKRGEVENPGISAPQQAARLGPVRDPSLAVDNPEKREVTIAVFGVANIEELGQMLDPEDLSSKLDLCSEQCQSAVHQHGGALVNQFGDKLIFVFGYPNADEHDAEKAVLAAFEAVNLSKEIQENTPVKICCGISQGEIFVAAAKQDISQKGPNFSGAVLFKATKLEQMAAADQVLVSFAVHATLKNNFEMQQVETPDKSARAYWVGAEKPYASRFEIRGLSDTLTRLTGRARELEHLGEIWAAARLGAGSIAAIQGEAGIGKSRLAHTFLEKIKPEDPLILRFAGSPHHQQTALFPIIHGLRNMLKLEAIKDGPAKTKAVSDWLDHLGLDRQIALQPLLCLLLPDVDWAENLHADMVGKQTGPPVEILISCFRAMARHRPVLIFFEDLHWMDPTTHVLIKSLATQVHNIPVMVLMALRPEGRQSWFKNTPLFAIELTRLNKKLSAELVQSICPKNWPAKTIEMLVSRSDGIPLFLEELVSAVMEENAGASGNASRIPESLHASLMARIDRLGQAKMVLQNAAVIGRIFDHDLLAQVVDLESSELQTHLDQLQARKLIYRIGRGADTSYEFKHVLVQELTYRSILKDCRTTYHLRTAEALQKQPQNLTSATPEVTARHFAKAGKYLEAIEYLEVAGKHAVRISAHQEAATHFGKAVSLVGKLGENDNGRALELKFLLLLGPQLIAAHGFASDEAITVYARARALGQDGKDAQKLCHVLWGLWGHYVVRADIRTAIDIGDQFLGLADQAKDIPGIVAGQYMAGVTRFYGGQFGEAEKCFQAALKAYRPDQHEEQKMRFGVDLSVTSQSYLTWICALQGQTDTAMALSQRVILQAEQTKHDFSIGFAQVFVACMYNFLLQPVQAEQHASFAADLSVGQGFAQLNAQAKIQLGRASAVLGKENALLQLQSGMHAYFSTGAELARPYAQAWLAEAVAEKGSVDQAITMIEETLAFSKNSHETYFDSELLRLKAMFLLRLGKDHVEDAEKCFAQSLDMAITLGAHLLRLRTATGYAQHLVNSGRQQKAKSILEEALHARNFSENQVDVVAANSMIKIAL